MKFTSFRILLFVVLPILVLTSFVGVKPAEEGYILNAANSFLKGFLPYRDFHYSYTPLSIFLTAFALNINASILSSRMLFLILSLASSIFLFRIIIFTTHNKIYAFLATLLFIIFTSLYINYPSPIVFGYFTSLAAIWLLMKFLETRRKVFLFPAGLLSFTVFLSHQGFGLAIITAASVFFCIKNSRRFYFISYFLYGYLWGITFFILYLISTDSFAGFIKDIENLKFLFKQNSSEINILLNTSALFLIFILHIFTIIILVVRRRFHLIFLQIYSTAILILNFYSSNVMIFIPLLGIPLSLLIRYSVSTNARLLFYLSFLAIVTLGVINLSIRVSEMNKVTFVNNPRVFIFADRKLVKETQLLSEVVSGFGYKNSEIFIISDNTLLYFWLDITMPSVLIGSKVSDPSVSDKIVGHLVAKDIKIVIVDQRTIIPVKLDKYLKDLYINSKHFGNFSFLVYTP